MICLHCEAPLTGDKPQTCRCKVKHELRPPVAGVNHVSQLLAALDRYRGDELDIEEFEDAFDVFSDYFYQFERRWRGKGPLVSLLSPTLAHRFTPPLTLLDQALDSGARGLELLQNLEEAAEEELEEAEAALLRFVEGIANAGQTVTKLLT